MKLDFCGKTDKGLVRQNNEDSFVILPDLASGSGVGLILADGMGGHNRGELASSVAATYAADRMQKEINQHQSPREIGSIMAEIVERANVKVYLESLISPMNTGMGTTLTLAFATDDLVVISHVGDCRFYRAHHGSLDLLTTDHTLGQELVNKGEITMEEMSRHTGRHMLTRALGVAEYISADVYIYKISGGDRLLLCTDGLYGYVPEHEIHRILSGSRNAEACAEALVAEANRRGGGDNVTVLVGFL